MEFHPYANIFPILDQRRLDELARDIEENGLREPIVVYDGKILDGRNRWFACERAGVTPETERATVADDEGALRLAISLNLHRRHLTEAQRAMAALTALPMLEQLARERRRATQNNNAARAECAPVHTQVAPPLPVVRMPDGDAPFRPAPPPPAPKPPGPIVYGPLVLPTHFGPTTVDPEDLPPPSARAPVSSSPTVHPCMADAHLLLPKMPPPPGTPEHEAWAAAGKARRAADDAAQAFNVSARTIANAKVVGEHGVPELADAVRAGHVAMKPAAALAREPEDVQREVVRRLDEHDIGVAAALAEVKKTPHVAHNSGDNEWYTPPDIIAAVRAVMGRIDLDPASCEHANRTVGATRFFTSEDDGLAHDWRGHVWLNPPYESGLVDRFAVKLVEEFSCRHTDEAITIVNNATETRWFQMLADSAAAICIIKGRVRYLKADGVRNTPLQGQAVLYFGWRPNAFCDVFGELGICFVKPGGSRG